MRSIRGLYRPTEVYQPQTTSSVDILLLGRYNHVSTSYKSYNCIISRKNTFSQNDTVSLISYFHARCTRYKHYVINLSVTFVRSLVFSECSGLHYKTQHHDIAEILLKVALNKSYTILRRELSSWSRVFIIIRS